MRIAYVDHSFHKTTLSNREILPMLLQQSGHSIDYFWDEVWSGGKQVSIREVMDYDAIIMFQSHCSLDGFSCYGEAHPNVTFIPMLDQLALQCGPAYELYNFFAPLHGCKVVSFSLGVHAIALAYGVQSYFTRYFRVPQAYSVPQNGLHGFFWLRHEDQVSWKTVRTLIGDTHFDSLHLHLAHDPFTPDPKLPTQKEIKKYTITSSTWFADKSEYEKTLSKANIFFAPRASEGIGQSFLEAFACGQCVVAPNQGTMNEYILDDHNGLLYDHREPAPLDFSSALQLGKTGYSSAVAGYKQWCKQGQQLVDYICCDSAKTYEIPPQRLITRETILQSPSVVAAINKNDTSWQAPGHPSTISWEAVTWAYRLLCNREPDSAEKVLQLAALPDQKALVQYFLESSEFQENIKS